MADWRNRIVRMERVRAGDLTADPRNWRGHPVYQRNALLTVLEQVGIVDPLIVREAPDGGGLILIDGHLRAELDPDTELPVVVVDLDEAEAGAVLASFDSLGAMAEVDVDVIDDLLGLIDNESTQRAIRDLYEDPPDIEVPDPPKGYVEVETVHISVRCEQSVYLDVKADIEELVQTKYDGANITVS